MSEGEPSSKADETGQYASLVVAEFNYIAETAFQANEDRARVSNFFFVTFATFIAAIFSTQLKEVDTKVVYTAFALVFLLVTALGGLTLLQLAKLRLAWFESARAMNHIKERATQAYPALAGYFRWNTQTLPGVFSANSVGFYMALMVAALGGLTLGSAVAFYRLANGSSDVSWGITLAAGLVGMAGLISLCYWLPLKRAAAPRGPHQAQDITP